MVGRSTANAVVATAQSAADAGSSLPPLAIHGPQSTILAPPHYIARPKSIGCAAKCSLTIGEGRSSPCPVVAQQHGGPRDGFGLATPIASHGATPERRRTAQISISRRISNTSL